jgi:predicted phage-related endonuclease
MTTELIEAAKATITQPKATKVNPKAVEADNPSLVNELLARRSTIADQMKELDAEKKEIDNIIRDLIGKKDILTVHGAEVASISRWRETQIVSEVVKEMFPVVDYPELYQRKDQTRLNIKK